jgi:hypothetical protein
MKIMNNNEDNYKLPVKQIDNEVIEKRKGFLLYLNNEDLFNKFQIEDNTNPDDLSDIDISSDIIENDNERDLDSELMGDNLDVPGSELDDQEENIGSEDEENNYYSIGGENHDSLEEDKGE